MTHITLILGGARCGKSVFAETLAANTPHSKFYIATAEAGDREMQDRIALHQKRRGDDWTTLEIPLALPELIASPEYKNATILVDCLTLWLSNLLCHNCNSEEHIERLIESLRKTAAHIIFVSNEVGQGIVPNNPLARQFRDDAGLLHQKIAAIATHVIWMVAGIPTYIKGSAHG